MTAPVAPARPALPAGIAELAQDALAKAATTDLLDPLAVVGSHSELRVALRAVLYQLGVTS